VSTVRNTHVYDDTAKDGRDMGDVFNYLGGLISQLTTDVGNLVTLHIDLLKVELRDSAKTLARDSILVIAGAVVGLFAMGALTMGLIALISTFLPLQPVMAVAASAGIVMLVYAIIAGVLVMLGINHLKKRGLKPERSVEEIRRDKEWVQEIRK